MVKGNTQCERLEKFFPEFAEKMSENCERHEKDYKAKRGCRFARDWEWFVEAWKINKILSVLCLIILWGFGWYLWYNVDDWFKFGK